MSEHYDFHYQPTGSGAISGQQVLQQTEDAINELGDYVNDNVGGAMDVAQQALETAQNAETNAQTALDTANSFSGAIQSAQQDASTALSTAQTAQTTASNANNTAIQAQQDASSAVTTANNASGQVNTLSGTVTALGQRVTTAEGNIGQNTSDITALTTRVGTAEGNITTLQNDVSIAQGNASSAMATAGTVKQQAYVLRYSSSSVTDNSTIAYSTLDNTDNIKSGDKVIDVDGKIFTVVSVDTANQTVTVGSALIDLALDSNVVHTSGNETVGGVKTFNSNTLIYNSDVTAITPNLYLRSSKSEISSQGNTSGDQNLTYSDKNNVTYAYVKGAIQSNGSAVKIRAITKDSSDNSVINELQILAYSNGNKVIFPSFSDEIDLGLYNYRWKSVYAQNYYYGSNNVEFSTKFVTTDTEQTISGVKTFSSNTLIYNSDNTANTPNLILQSSKIQLGDTTASDSQGLIFNAGNSFVAKVDSFKDGSGTQNLQNHVRTKDASNNIITAMYRLRLFNSGLAFLESSGDNTISLGRISSKWKDCQTYLINSLTPSSLSMPDIANKIDISSYVTDLTGNLNTYTPPVNGWICIQTDNSSVNNYIRCTYDVIMVKSSGNGQANALSCLIPVIANTQVGIRTVCTTLSSAYFIPCQGNV